jgi:hypothetical protein
MALFNGLKASKMKASHDAELLRLALIRRRYAKIKHLINDAYHEGVRCVSRTGHDDMEIYWLIDRDGRLLTGEYGHWMEAWLSYLE